MLTLCFVACATPEDPPAHTERDMNEAADHDDRPPFNHQVFGPPCDPFAALPEDARRIRIVEIDPPRGRGYVVTPTNFGDIVSPEVVKNTMAVYACTNHFHDQRDALANVLGVGRGHDLSIEGLSYFARTMAYVHLGIDSLSETDSSDYFAASDAAREIVREHLRDPARLKEEYARYKPTLVEGVSRSLAPAAIRSYLRDTVIPYFTEPIPDSVLDAERTLLAIQTRCQTRLIQPEAWCDAAEQSALRSLMDVTPDYRVLQWMHRRRAEGGEELVRAWGDILVDFADSI